MQQDQNVKKTRGNASKFELCALYMTYELFASLFFLGMWRVWEDTGNFYNDQQKQKRCLTIGRSQLLQGYVHSSVEICFVRVTNGGI